MHIQEENFERRIQQKPSNNYSFKRIARNTLMLYVRTGVLMIVTFYTTRVLLLQLGVKDYGIYNVLMGVITFFAFASNSMTTATQRFISAALGEGKKEKVRIVFSASIYMYIVMIVLCVILFESIGLLYVNNYINVPEERFFVAQVVYQMVIVQFIFLTFRIPYNSVVIAYERMDFYAYISIIEAILALGLIYILSIAKVDKLIFYTMLLAFTRLIVLSSYIIYCIKIVPECRIVNIKKIPKKVFKEIGSFTGWNIFGSFANIANNHGVNLIVNFFCGVVVNAAIGISSQLTQGLYTLVANLQNAFNPQIIKLYAAKEYGMFKMLLYRNSRFCFFLYLMILVPSYICIDEVLVLWLNHIPDWSIEFCRCMLFYLAIEAMSYPLSVAIQADGNVGRYQQYSGCLFLLFMLVAYVLLSIGLSPICVFVTRILQNICLTTCRLLYLKHIMSFNVWDYFRNVILKCITVLFLSFGISWGMYKVMDIGGLGFLVVIIFSSMVTSFTIIIIGLTSEERMLIYNAVKHRVILKM